METWFLMEINKNKMQKIYNDFSNKKFPSNYMDDELHELFAELVAYDGYVVGSINSLIHGKGIVLERLKSDKINDKFKYLSNSISSEDFVILERYYLSIIALIDDAIMLSEKKLIQLVMISEKDM